MDGQWYWDHRGDVVGPLSTDVVAELIRNRRIHDSDRLRLSESTEWLTGTAVKEMFADERGQADKGGAAEAASQLLQANRFQGTSRPEDFNLLESVSFGLRQVWRVVSSFPSHLSRAFFLVISTVRAWCNRWTISTVLLVLLVQVSINRLNPPMSEYRYLHMGISHALDEVRILYSTNAATPEWEQFRENHAPLIEDALAQLSRNDKQFNNRMFLSLFSYEEEDAESRYHLMQAGHRLRDLYSSTKIDSDQLIAAAEKHLAAAENVLSGHYLIQKKRHKIDKAIVLANRLGKPLPPPPTDLWLVGKVTVSILLWIFGGYLCWRWSN